MKRTKQSPAVDSVADLAKPILGAATREYKFHLGAGGKRRWAFDLAWPDLKVAVEIEGGVWSGGRHTSGAGYSADCEKYSVAAILGWTVIRLTPQMAKNEEVLTGWLMWNLSSEIHCGIPGDKTIIVKRQRRKK